MFKFKIDENSHQNHRLFDPQKYFYQTITSMCVRFQIFMALYPVNIFFKIHFSC